MTANQNQTTPPGRGGSAVVNPGGGGEGGAQGQRRGAGAALGQPLSPDQSLAAPNQAP